MQSNKYFFDHLAKTGGMSMINIFHSIFGSENVTLPTSGDIGDVEAYLHDNEGYTVVAGHVQLKFGCNPLFQRKTITCLRDPVDRALSSFFYWRNDIPKGGGDIVDLAKDVSVEEYFRVPEVAEAFSGFYVKHFSALASREIPEAPEECLELAKLALESFDFVGIYEYYRDTVDFMCLNFGWPAVEEVPVINKTSKRQEMEEIPPDALSRIRELTRHDAELYGHALKLFERRRRALLREAIRGKSLQGGPSDVQEDGEPEDGARHIVRSFERGYREFGSMELSISSVTVNGIAGGEIDVVGGGRADVSVYISSAIHSRNVVVGFAVYDQFRRHLYGTNTFLLDQAVVVFPGQICKVTFAMPLNLPVGRYELSCCVHDGPDHRVTCYHWKDLVARFQVVNPAPCRFEGTVNLDTSVSWTISDSFDIFRFSMELADGLDFSCVEANRSIVIDVRVRNESGIAVKTTGGCPLALSYHWLTAEGGVLVFEGARTFIDDALGSGGSRAIGVRVDVPDAAGPCVLRLSMVLEGVAWFEDRGMAPIDVPLTIVPAPSIDAPG